MVQGGGYRGEDCRVDSALQCTLHSVERAVDMKGDTHEMRVGQQDFLAKTIVGNRNEQFSLL